MISTALVFLLVATAVAADQWRETRLGRTASLRAGSPAQTGEPGRDPMYADQRVWQVSAQKGEGRRGPTTVFGDSAFLLDTSITMLPAPLYQDYVAAASGVSSSLVVWADSRSGSSNIYGARITSQGTVLDPAGIAISDGTEVSGAPALAFDGVNYLVVWSPWQNGSYDILCARVSPEGVVLDPGGFVICDAPDGQYGPALGFAGGCYMVVWTDDRNGDSMDIYGARVAPEGAVLDPEGVAISRTAGRQSGAAISHDSGSFLVVWQDERNGTADIYGARISSSGSVLDTGGMVISKAGGGQFGPALDFDGRDFLVVWYDERDGSDYDIYGARVTPRGTVIDTEGIAISRGAERQYSPDLEFDGANFLVVWHDERHGWTSSDIYGTRVTPQGGVLDQDGVAISQAPSFQWRPAVAFNGVGFLVAWEDHRNAGDGDIYCARVSSEASVLEPSGVLVSQAANSQSFPVAAFDGIDFLAVWLDTRDGGHDVYGSRVSPRGVILDPGGVCVSRSASGWTAPALAFGGSSFFVAWEDERQGVTDIYGARISPTGVVLEAEGVVVSQAVNEQRDPAVAFGAGGFFAVWRDDRSRDSPAVYGARLSPQGSLLDPEGVRISPATGRAFAPAVAFDGAHFLVVWSECRGESLWDVRGARVTTSGRVLDPSGIDITDAPGAQFGAAVQFDGSDFLVVWEDSRGGDRSGIYAARVTPEGRVLDTSGIVISQGANYRITPAVAFDGSASLVVYALRDSTGWWHLRHARVTPQGSVYDMETTATQAGDQSFPSVCRGSDGQMFLVYSGWTATASGRVYNAARIWGAVSSGREPAESESLPVGTGTILRGILFLPKSLYYCNTGLYDAVGRLALDLHPGPNEVRHLAPGVYFVRSAVGGERSAVFVRKVVIAR